MADGATYNPILSLFCRVYNSRINKTSVKKKLFLYTSNGALYPQFINAHKSIFLDCPPDYCRGHFLGRKVP